MTRLKNKAAQKTNGSKAGWCAVLLTTLLAAALPLSAQDNRPSIAGDMLTMPVVIVLDSAFRLDWRIVANGPAVDLVLVDFAEVTGVDTTGAPSFFGTLLSLPALELDGLSYWGEFTLVSGDPVTFRLQAVDVNNPGSSGVEGKWHITETVSSNDCGEDNETLQYDFLVLQDGNQLSIGTDAGIFQATLNGNSLMWTGSYDEDGGTTTANVDVTFSSDLASFQGSTDWSWTNGSVSCSGTSVASGVLRHN